tara:strand:+ start:1240 stop:1818 length:579 start_codon:yes stop_codon:yes gene_type:complete
MSEIEKARKSAAKKALSPEEHRDRVLTELRRKLEEVKAAGLSQQASGLQMVIDDYEGMLDNSRTRSTATKPFGRSGKAATDEIAIARGQPGYREAWIEAYKDKLKSNYKTPSRLRWPSPREITRQRGQDPDHLLEMLEAGGVESLAAVDARNTATMDFLRDPISDVPAQSRDAVLIAQAFEDALSKAEEGDK